MIELAKHIEVLLLENDCVIVPGFGGFIAHNCPAVVQNENNTFCPPIRTVGFNPQLVINDGLLVQSYMQAYNTDFPDATRKIEKEVMALKDELYQEGHVELSHVGTVYYTMNGSYAFEPSKETCFTPYLYGLTGFSFQPLPVRTENISKKHEVSTTVKTPKAIHFHPYQWARNVAAVAAAILLFFILSFPVENTYIDETNYASLGTSGMFEAIRHQSVATTLAKQSAPQQQTQRVRHNINTLKPTAVKTEKIAPRPVETKLSTAEAKPSTAKTAVKKSESKAETPKTTVKPVHIIVSSLATQADADRELKKIQEQGYKDARILASQGRFRISLQQYDNANEAYRKVTKLRESEQFKNAWVFTSK